MCDGFSSYISLAESTRRFPPRALLDPRAQEFFELGSSFATEAKQVLDLIDELFAVEAFVSPAHPLGAAPRPQRFSTRWWRARIAPT